MHIGINAISVRSVGGLEHIKKIIEKFDDNNNYVSKITIWCSPEAYLTLKGIKNSKINILKINFNNIILQHIYLFFLSLKSSVNIFYSLNGTAISFNSIILYQNLLPFDDYEIIRHGVSVKTVKFFLLRISYKFSYYLSKGRIYLNIHNKNIIEKKIGIKDKNYEIIPHGISDDFLKIKKKKKTDNNFISLLYVSNFEIYKNHINVLYAYIKYLELNNKQKISITFVGKFVDSNIKIEILKLKKIIDSYKNAKLKILNFSTKKKIISLMNSSNGIIFASSCESFGFPVLEAMAMKKSLLCSDSSGLKSFTQNKAIYFNPFNAKSIFNSFNKFIELKKNKFIYKLSNYKWNLISKNTFEQIIKLFINNKSLKTSFKKEFFKIFNYSYRASYLFNYYLLNIIFVNAYLLNKYLFINSFLYATSFCLLITSFFSGNDKNLLLKNFKDTNFNSSLSLRLSLSIFIIFLSLMFNNFLLMKDFFIVFSSSSLVCIIWIYDILLVKLEKVRKHKLMKRNLIFLSLIVIIFNVFLLLKYVDDFLLLINLLIILYLFKIIYLHFIVLRNFNYILKYNLHELYLSMKFYSSYIINLSNFILRFCILNSFSIKDSTNIILGLSVMSVPQTLVSNSIGPSYVSAKRCFPTYFNLLLTLYFLGSIYFIFFNVPLQSIILFNGFDILYIMPAFFFIGLIFFLSQFIRQIKLFNSDENNVFKNDIIYSLIFILGITFIFIVNKFLLLYVLLSFSFLSIFLHLKKN
jgi:hypothetical protein